MRGEFLLQSDRVIGKGQQDIRTVPGWPPWRMTYHFIPRSGRCHQAGSEQTTLEVTGSKQSYAHWNSASRRMIIKNNKIAKHNEQWQHNTLLQQLARHHRQVKKVKKNRSKIWHYVTTFYQAVFSPNSLNWYRRKLGGKQAHYVTHRPPVCGLAASAGVWLTAMNQRSTTFQQALAFGWPLPTPRPPLYVFFLIGIGKHYTVHSPLESSLAMMCHVYCMVYPTRALRSSRSKLLQIPYTSLRFGSCSFHVSVPNFWHSLPPSVHFCESQTTFWKHLKTFYFQSSFSVTY